MDKNKVASAHEPYSSKAVAKHQVAGPLVRLKFRKAKINLNLSMMPTSRVNHLRF